MSEYRILPGKEIFPIHTETACLLKWSWSTINLETGTSSSCHRVNANEIDPDNFKNFHNLPEKIQAREAMLRGEWPGNGCEYCKRVEDFGGMSDRLMTLERHHGIDKCPPELLVDPTATSVTPIILEVYFSNTCNLACVYCLPELSSRINAEMQKFGEIQIDDFSQKIHITNNTRYESMVADLWKYLEEDNRYQVIRHYHVLGGESLVQKELDQSIEFWKLHPNSSLTFNVITNMMLPHRQFVEKMEKFKELVDLTAIYMLDLTASLDCWGPQQEYIRYGTDLDVWQKNFEYMLDKPWCRLSIHSCISSLSIKTMPDLINKINYWNTLRPAGQEIEHNYDLPVRQGLSGLHPTAFGPGVFTEDFNKIISSMPDTTEMQKTARKQMIGQANLIENSTKKVNRINTLKKYLTELDSRRGTHWRDVFPWLDRQWD